MARNHIHPLTIKAGYYKPLGQFIAGWNLTELYIQTIIWHIYGITDPKKGRMITYGARASDKLKILSAAIDRWVTNAADKAEMHSICVEAGQLNSKRNTFAHGVWGHLPRQSKVLKIFYTKEADDRLLLKREVTTVNDLKALADRVYQLNLRLDALNRRLGALRP